MQGQHSNLEVPADTITGPEVQIIANSSSTAPVLRLSYDDGGLKTNDREKRITLLGAGAEYVEDFSNQRANNYGPGLATISFQGRGSTRSQLAYRSLDLRSPASGVVDVSLFAPFQLSDAWMSTDLPYSSDSTRYFTSKGQLIVGLGSFEDHRLGLDFRGSIRHAKPAGLPASKPIYERAITNFGGNIYLAQTENNYAITDERGRERKLPNARSEQLKGELELSHQTSNGQHLSASALFITADRRLPPPLDQLNSRARQLDQQLHSQIRYGSGDRGPLRYQFSWKENIQRLRFQDPDLDLDATTRAGVSVLDLNLQRNDNLPYVPYRLRFPFNLRTTHILQWAAPNNARREQRQWWEIQTQFNHNFQNYWSLSIRPGLSLGQTPGKRPFLQGLISLRKQQLHFQYRRQLRRPTLNDLFWPELGELNLKAEVINSGEIGYRAHGDRGFSPSILLFHHDIRNAIRWLPENGQFRPRNFSTLRSSGVEGGINLSSKYWLLGLSAQYTQVRQAGSNRQLAYEPKLTSRARLRFASKKFSFTYRLHYQSAVNTLAAADNKLPATWLHHIDFSHTFGAFELQLRLRNLTNLNYQRVAGYPLPGRHYRLQAIYDF